MKTAKILWYAQYFSSRNNEETKILKAETHNKAMHKLRSMEQGDIRQVRLTKLGA